MIRSRACWRAALSTGRNFSTQSTWARAGTATAAIEHLRHFAEYAEIEAACPRGASIGGGNLQLQRSGAAIAAASRAVQRISDVAATLPGGLGAAMVRAAGRRASAVLESSQNESGAVEYARTAGSRESQATDSDDYAVASAAAEAAEGALASARVNLAVAGTPAEAAAATMRGIALCEAALPGGGGHWGRPSAFESDAARIAAHMPLVISAARLHSVAVAAAALSTPALPGSGGPPQRGIVAPAPSATVLSPAAGAHSHAGVLLSRHIAQCAAAVGRHSSDAERPLDARGCALSLALHAVSVSARASTQRNAAAAYLLRAWRASLSAQQQAADRATQGGQQRSGGGLIGGAWAQDPGGAAGALAAAHTILAEELAEVDALLTSYEHFGGAGALGPLGNAALVRVVSDAALHRVALLSSLAEVGWSIALASVGREGGGANAAKSPLVGMSEADADTIAPLLRGVRSHAERALALAERMEVAAMGADCPGARAFAGKGAAAAAAAGEAAGPAAPAHVQPHELGWRWSDYGPDPGAGVARPLRTLAALHELGGTAILAEGLLTTCVDRHRATFCLPAGGGLGPGPQLLGLPPLQRAQAGASLQALGRLLGHVEKRGGEAARLSAAGDKLQASAASALGLLPPPGSAAATDAPGLLGDRHLLTIALGVLHVGSTAEGSLETDLAAVVGAI